MAHLPLPRVQLHYRIASRPIVSDHEAYTFDCCDLQTAQGRSVLEVDTAGMYRPVTRETRDAFEALLAFIREQYDDQPYDVLKGAAEEVLAVLKNEGLKVNSTTFFALLLFTHPSGLCCLLSASIIGHFNSIRRPQISILKSYACSYRARQAG